jgi:phosphopantetheinyl transferase
MPWPTVASSSGGEVEVWLIVSDQPPDVVTGLAALLDQDERERAALRSLAGHRDRYAVAHGAARMIIGRHTGIEPGRIRWRYGPYGKPELDQGPADPASGHAGPPELPQISLSHSGGLAALALAHGRQVGVDVQEFTPGLDPVRFSQRYFPPNEARFVKDANPPTDTASTAAPHTANGPTPGTASAPVPGAADGPPPGAASKAPRPRTRFVTDGKADVGTADPPAPHTANGPIPGTASGPAPGAADEAAGQMARFVRLWARKEACVKVSGGRLMQGMLLPVQGDGYVLVTDPAGALPGQCLVRDVPVPPGFGAAVAAAGSEPFGLRVFWWPADLD